MGTKMIKFVSEEDNSRAVFEMLSSKKKLKCAVAFWGEYAWDCLNESNQIVKIICNLESGATNPFLIKKLMTKSNFHIKTNQNLHAKVILAEDTAIIGSTNISANGLSMEDEEIKGYIEASIVTSDKNVLTSINEWFERQWESACEINKYLLKLSEERWLDKRKSRLNKVVQKNNKKMSLLEALKNNTHEFKDRKIFICIYRSYASPEAKNKFSEVKTEMQSNSKSILDFYENWSDLPEDSYLIDIYYGSRGGFEHNGIFKTSKPHIIEKFEYENGEEGEITICFRSNSVMGFKITKHDKDLLRNNISALWKSEKSNVTEDESARIISLYDAKSCLFR